MNMVFRLLLSIFIFGVSHLCSSDKDWCMQKCETWSAIKKFHSTDHYKVISDLSGVSDSKRNTLKILLPNGLEVFLISDLSLIDSSASLSVEAGTWDDPSRYPGMAHFVEHLLFLGTEKYPRESEYSQYILERGGQYNAFTKHDRTSYGFSIPSSSFLGALDRFSQFFIAPLFTSSAIEREMHAVYHEFEDLVESDSLRVWRVLKESGNPEHPNAKLSCGNLESLMQVKRQDIVQWFHEHYHPQKMRLVLMSPEPLEKLAELAHLFFSRIPEEGRGASKLPKEKSIEMTSPQQRGHLTYIKPAFKNRSLFLMWEIPSFFLSLENIKAVHLLQMALDHSHPNSLSKILERESLAKEVHSDFWKMNHESAFFMLHIVLTDQGISQCDEVVSQCFQALNRIKQLGIPFHLLQKLQRIESFQWNSSFDSSFDYVMRISSELLDENIETYPCKTYASSEESLEKALSFMQELNPFRCLYFLVASPEEAGVKMSRIEKWMGTEYFIRKIPEYKLEQWNAEAPHPLIGFQPEETIDPPQKDIPYTETEMEQREIADPIFIVDNAKARIRWLESSSSEDSIDAFFCIATPFVGSSAQHAALNEFFIHRLHEVFKKEFEEEKKVLWSLEIDGIDLCLSFSAPKGKYLDYFRRFFILLKTAEISKEQFDSIKKKKLDSYPGDPSPLEYAHQILDSFVRPSHYTKMEIYHALLELDFEDYEAFQKMYFDEIFLEGAFLGGASQSQLVELWEEISLLLDGKTYRSEKDRAKQFIFPEKPQSYFITQKTHRKGNALLLILEAGEATPEIESIHKLLTIVLHSEFFEGLRTKQQTAYKLYTWNEVMNQRICHCFALQSSSHSPKDLLCRVEKFLNDFSSYCSDLLSEERFEVIKDTLIFNGQRQKHGMEKAEDFEYLETRMNSLENLTYEKIIEEIEAVFSTSNRKRIAILVEGSEPSISSPDQQEELLYLPIEKKSLYP